MRVSYWTSARQLFLIMICFAALLLSGCIVRFDPDAMQPQTGGEAPLTFGSHTIGQTFVAVRPRLSAIEIELASTNVPLPIILRLRTSPDTFADLAVTEINTLNHDQASLQWEFPPIADSAGHSYYLQIQAPQSTTDRPLRLQAAPHGTYGAGSSYVDGIKSSGDLTFYSFYDYDQTLFWNDLVNASGELWVIFPLLLLFLCPGFLILQFLPTLRERFDGWEQIAIALGLSLAFIPFLFLRVTEFGGALSQISARLLFGGIGASCLGVIGMRLYRRSTEPKTARKRSSSNGLIALSLGLILTVGLIVRLVAIRDLCFPAWIDSAQHVLLSRIIAESGKVPTSYQPYLEVRDATYHFGFQSSVAIFAWLSGKSLTQATLVLGQIFNLAMGLQVYLFARWLTARPRTAFIAALIVTLLSTMPAYYVSWGSYTQLSGLLILPVATVLTMEAIKWRDWRAAVISGFIASGLILTHYHAFMFYVCLVVIGWLFLRAGELKSFHSRVYDIGWLVGIWLLAFILIMPWIARVVTNLWLVAVDHWMDTYQGGAGTIVPLELNLEYLVVGFDRYLLVLGLLGGAIALIERRWFAGALLAWMVAIYIIAKPSLLGLPFGDFIPSYSILISWFMPLAILCGSLWDDFSTRWITKLGKKMQFLAYTGAALVLAVLSYAGIYKQVTIVNPNTVMALQSDQEALNWIDAHIPPGSRFLINAQRWTSSTLYVGTDGGYWITPLTHSTSTTPPALYIFGGLDVYRHILQSNRHVETVVSNPEELRDLLRSEGVDYIYIGALGGPLDLQILQSPGFRLLYDNGRVSILELENK